MANSPFYSQCFAKNKTFWRNLWTFTWLVVLTILINISQWEGLSHIYIYISIYIYIVENINMFETTNQFTIQNLTPP